MTALDALPASAACARPDPTPAPLPPLEAGERRAEVALADASSSLTSAKRRPPRARVLDRLGDGREVIVCGEPDAEAGCACARPSLRATSFPTTFPENDPRPAAGARRIRRETEVQWRKFCGA